MSDVMFPEPLDPMDRAMQRMDKKAWAEVDAKIATLKARLAEAERLLLRWHRSYIEDAVGAGGLECADDDTTTFLRFHAERATSSAPAGYDRRDICYCGGCAHTRIPSCPPRIADSADVAQISTTAKGG